MMKNDYRRALILLRAHDPGVSGHVRLERRTLIGSMFFTVGAPQGGTLCAALVRRDAQGAYYAFRLGELRRDGRGQATLAYSFDPRNIDGRPLEDYLLVVVVRATEENCDVILSGNVNGSREVSWNSVRAAACAACECQGSDCGLYPTRPYPRPEADAPSCSCETPPAEPEERAGETPIEAAPMDATPDAEATERAYEPAREAEDSGADSLEVEPPATSRTPFAGEALGIDMNAPWPGVSEQLREMFDASEAQELMLEDGYVYVKAPMPDGSGYDSVYIGVRAEDGAPDSVAYALPSRYSVEPPAGLEDYAWKGGAAEGWWVLYTDAATGEKLP